MSWDCILTIHCFMCLESLRGLPGVIQRQSLEIWMVKNQNQKAEVAETEEKMIIGQCWICSLWNTYFLVLQTVIGCWARCPSNTNVGYHQNVFCWYLLCRWVNEWKINQYICVIFLFFSRSNHAIWEKCLSHGRNSIMPIKLMS